MPTEIIWYMYHTLTSCNWYFQADSTVKDFFCLLFLTCYCKNFIFLIPLNKYKFSTFFTFVAPLLFQSHMFLFCYSFPCKHNQTHYFKPSLFQTFLLFINYSEPTILNHSAVNICKDFTTFSVPLGLVKPLT